MEKDAAEYILMIKMRKITAEEWSKISLAETEGFLSPENSIAIVAFDEEKPVGRIFLVEPVHLEGVHVEPSYRGKDVMKKLVDEAESEAQRLNVTTVFAYADGKEMEGYIERLGYERMNWTVWRKQL